MPNFATSSAANCGKSSVGRGSRDGQTSRFPHCPIQVRPIRVRHPEVASFRRSVSSSRQPDSELIMGYKIKSATDVFLMPEEKLDQFVTTLAAGQEVTY